MLGCGKYDVNELANASSDFLLIHCALLSYMAVLLNLTVSTDGLSIYYAPLILQFTCKINVLVQKIVEVLHRHVSCDLLPLSK